MKKRIFDQTQLSNRKAICVEKNRFYDVDTDRENSKSIIFAVISARHTKNLALYMAINHDSFISN